VRSCVVDYTFRAIFDQKFEELETLEPADKVLAMMAGLAWPYMTNLVDLPPLLGGLFGEAFVYHWHDLI
jgi:hypothetical protein